jgi:poly(3-hydroxyalkanoate) depolymerase
LRLEPGERHVHIGAQRVRISIRPGSGKTPPLLVCNGMGASLDLIAPFVDALSGVSTISFDVPGIGGSPLPLVPYRFWSLARLLAAMLDELGIPTVDVLGLSWGGGLAQQFALQYPGRCRRLVLAATSAGALMVPGRLSVIRKLLTPRRYLDPSYLARVAPDLYGGDLRKDHELAREHAYGRSVRQPSWLGYYYQLLAGTGWTSLPFLPFLRPPTLILAGTDDPIVPLTNARLLAWLIPHAKLHVVDCGHLFLITRAAEVAPVIRTFLESDLFPDPNFR